MVINLINLIKKLFAPKDPVEQYLASSHDVYDLENKLKELRRKGIWV